jgi:oligogalacturonide lyase
MKRWRYLLALACCCWLTTAAHGEDWITYQGKGGPANGKHLVFLTGDEEYRSEEGLPMLAKILAYRHGFKCTVLFAVDKDGTINPNLSASLPGAEALDSADAIVMLLRFRLYADETMKHFVDAYQRGVPIIGLRTSTHAFKSAGGKSPYKNFGAFGKQVLGEQWVSHWGKHKQEATRGIIEASAKDDPLLRGVADIFGDTDVYEAYPPADAKILVRGQVLKGMKPSDPPADYKRKRSTDKQEQGINDPMMPVVWTRLYKNEAGKENKVFCTTMGSSTDLQSEGLRRLVVNAVFWGLGLDIPARANVTYVGDYKPTMYGFNSFTKGVKPGDLVVDAKDLKLLEQPPKEKAGGGVPTEWIEPSGHRVIRLTGDDGGSSFYFHQNAYTAEGDKLLISTKNGLATIDLKTRKIEVVVEGKAGNVVVGKKSRTVYYTRGPAVYATHLDTKATRKLGTLPAEFGGGSGLAVNADETLLAGSATDKNGKADPKGKAGQPAGKGNLESRWAAGLAMVLYTMDIKTGEVKKILSGNDWFNHVQFSPSDPSLIMFCHEGPWHKVDRVWTIKTDGTDLRKIHTRTIDMEIWGHEFFGADGKTIWFDLQTPRSKEFWLAGVVVGTGEKIRYKLEREQWSVHFNVSPDGKLFAGDGGGPSSVAAPGNGQWIYLFTPRDGKFEAEKLVDLSKHNYKLEPNVTFTPDGQWIVFRSNLHGPTHVYAVEVKKSK